MKRFHKAHKEHKIHQEGSSLNKLAAFVKHDSPGLRATCCLNARRPKYCTARFETANRPTGFDAGLPIWVIKKVSAADKKFFWDLLCSWGIKINAG